MTLTTALILLVGYPLAVLIYSRLHQTFDEELYRWKMFQLLMTIPFVCTMPNTAGIIITHLLANPSG